MVKSIDERAEFSKFFSQSALAHAITIVVDASFSQSIVQLNRWKCAHVIPFDPNELDSTV